MIERGCDMRDEITSDDEYREALNAVRPFFDNEPSAGTADAEAFDRLCLAIEAYENRHDPFSEIAT
jgi:HTH-type transcriptional regulator / antitoxin HigA